MSTSEGLGNIVVHTTQWRQFRSKVKLEITNNSDNKTCKIVQSVYVGAAWSSYSGYSVKGYDYQGTQQISQSPISINNPSSATYAWSSAYTKTYNNVPRGHSAYAVSAYAVASLSGISNSSTAQTSITVPALASYAVTYNANGGDGAPAAQTKYYGEDLSLSATIPTRDGYNFLGWATSSSATVATYQAGGTYTTNATLNLWAVWETAHIKPVLSVVNAYRTVSGSTEDNSGTRGYFKLHIVCDTTEVSTNKVSTKTIQWRQKGTTAWNTAQNMSGTNATTMDATYTVGTDNTFAVDQSYDVLFTVTDTNGATAQYQTIITRAAFAVDIAADGVGVGCEAEAGLFKVGYPTRMVLADGETPTAVADFVVEEGTSSPTGIVWTWTKWASGKLEIWGTQTLSSTAVSTAIGGNYYNSSTKSFGNWPVPFVATPHTPMLSAINGKSIGGLALPVSWSATAAPSYYLWAVASVASTSIYVSVYACGRWK